MYVFIYFNSGNLCQLLFLLITNWEVPGRRKALSPGMYEMPFH